MGEKLLRNKALKMKKLYDAAYELFTSKGVHNTVIDDIVKHAGVAKGTFYLYCKDKYDLVDRVIIRKLSFVINNAMKALSEKKKAEELDFQESVIFFADYLINYFRGDTRFLELIVKNFSESLYQKLFRCEELEPTRKIFVENFMLNGGSSENAGKRLYLIVCLVSIVCYNSIVQKMPYTFEQIKPELYRSVRQILT